jgi:rare lipoprotein A
MRKLLTFVLLSAALALAGCSSNSSKLSKKYSIARNSKGERLDGFEGKGSSYYRGSGPIPKGGGRYFVGKPYSIAGRRFVPAEQPGYDRKGTASWYGEAFHRRKTSNGEYFDMAMLTAAHPTLPLPSYARVTNLANGRTIVVRINDRGPFVGTRIIDLSKKSADALNFRSVGKANVRVQWIGNAPVNDQGQHLAMMNRKVQQGASMNTLIAAADGPARGADADVQVASNDDEQFTPRETLQKVRYAKPKRKSRGAGQIVQVGLFKDLENAEAARRQLAEIAPVQVYEIDQNGQALYRVQLGPFLSTIGANDALEAAQSEGFPNAVLFEADIEQVSATP